MLAAARPCFNVSMKSLHLRVFLLLYNIFIRLYSLGLQIASAWNPKARKWVRGRKDLFKTIQDSFIADARPVLWMHCASLGEFEQGRFLIESIRRQYASVRIVITFFSPSGYEAVKNYGG